MEYIIIAIVAFGAAMLTFFSGFGLGTILLPVFALFFPVEIAIALTAVVHLANNLFKTSLVWRDIDLKVAALFAIPAAIFAIAGALVLNFLSGDRIILIYELAGKEMQITVVKLVISILLIIFAIIEIDKRFDKISLGMKYLPLGGSLSGFFGGLSGHQGALRSLFLLRAGLSKEGFIATGIISAVLIDISRLTVYGSSFFAKHFQSVDNKNSIIMILVACLAAFTGSFFGRKLLKKITMRSVQLTVGIMILIFALLLGAGII
jgi:uncharacterized protein